MISDPAMPAITWDKPKLKRFKKALAKAVQEQMSQYGTFKFEGQEFMIAYACYLAEYLNSQLK